MTHWESGIHGWKAVAAVTLSLVAPLGGLACATSRAEPGAGERAVRPGIDVLLADSLHLIEGKRVGLVTNLAAVDAQGASVVARFRAAPIQLVALFGPEHGLSAAADPGERVESSVDSASQIPIYSLYGRTVRPTSEMLKGIEVLVVDLPDVGARYYTYLATAVEVMRAAAAADIPVLIADRPNPIGGAAMQGNILDTAWQSMVGRLAMPMRTGLTLGEATLLANADMAVGARLTVVPAEGWRRAEFFEATGLPFRAPSPNLKDVDALFHYPGTCLFEGTALSVGRGTDLPFHQVGAPWLDHTAVIVRMEEYALPGVRYEAVRFTPDAPGDGKFAGVAVNGVRLVITDRERYDPAATAVYLLTAIRAVHPERVAIGGSFDRLAGGTSLRAALERGDDPAGIVAGWQEGLAGFRERVAGYLLYR
jgi:uncharacterized protein YbbC (DUF1343 family)